MNQNISKLFSDQEIIVKIKTKLPDLFQIAELESERGGKVGMEVGSLRERILISLFMYYFGEENINSNLAITTPEADVIVCENPISIKTKSGSGYSSVKLIWTVDPEMSKKFLETYNPSCDMIFVHINWGKSGSIYYFPVEIQTEVFKNFGRNNYIKLPTKGTNPRGVEIESKALKSLINHNKSLKIEVDWIKRKINFNKYERWLELWDKDLN